MTLTAVPKASRRRVADHAARQQDARRAGTMRYEKTSRTPAIRTAT